MIDEKKFMEFMTALEEAGAEHVSFDDLRKFMDEQSMEKEWIYCGDGNNFPDKAGDYWATFILLNDKHTLKERIWAESHAERFVSKLSFGSIGSWPAYADLMMSKRLEVIAWMPIPDDKPNPYMDGCESETTDN